VDPRLAHSLGALLLQADVQAALSGDTRALRALVGEIEPVVRVRVARALYRYRQKARRRNLAQEADDLSQEVFVELFRNEGGALRSWDPARGLSLAGFVRLIADRTAGAVLSSGVRTPWRDEPMDPHELSEGAGAGGRTEERVMSRDLAAHIYQALTVELTPLAFKVFEVLFVDEASVEAACAQLQMSHHAIYAWQNRLSKIVRRLATELENADDAPPGPRRAAGTKGES
jgi:DNA-directed RNA polymerase specialized sigma24 family protein